MKEFTENIWVNMFSKLYSEKTHLFYDFAVAVEVEDYSTDCIAHLLLPAYQLGNG